MGWPAGPAPDRRESAGRTLGPDCGSRRSDSFNLNHRELRVTAGPGPAAWTFTPRMDWLVIALVILWVATFLLMVFFWRRSESALRRSELALRKMESYLFGTRWHYISDFRHTYMQISNKSCYGNFASKIKFTVFPLFCPLKRGLEVAFKDRRTSVVIKSGILSESRPYQKAHLIPHSASCNASWKLVFEPLLWSFAKTNTLYPLNKLLDMMLYGFRDENSNIRWIPPKASCLPSSVLQSRRPTVYNN